jgi:hypothetical protein
MVVSLTPLLCTVAAWAQADTLAYRPPAPETRVLIEALQIQPKAA